VQGFQYVTGTVLLEGQGGGARLPIRDLSSLQWIHCTGDVPICFVFDFCLDIFFLQMDKICAQCWYSALFGAGQGAVICDPGAGRWWRFIMFPYPPTLPAAPSCSCYEVPGVPSVSGPWNFPPQNHPGSCPGSSTYFSNKASFKQARKITRITFMTINCRLDTSRA